MAIARRGVSIRKALRREFRFYGSGTRRRGRLLRDVFRARRAAGGLKPEAGPLIIRRAQAVWFDDFPNFGDALTPWLLTQMGVVPKLASSEDAQLVGVGSILELLQPGFRGHVWGSGLLLGDPVDLPYAQWGAVRGALTMRAQGLSDVATGDPGLLVSRFLPKVQVSHQVGVVPHHAHKEGDFWKKFVAEHPGVKVIDPVGQPTDVIREIASCEAILTTSLHGLITADSYGIPALWLDIVDELPGGRFKFLDYESNGLAAHDRCLPSDRVRQLRWVVDSMVPADAGLVRRVQEDLLSVLEDIELESVPFYRSVV